MRIDWRALPSHKLQRYDSSGDWYWSDDGATLNIRVSHLSNPRYEFLLGLHEVIEAMLCRFDGISHETVDAFDMPYEKDHAAGNAMYPCGCPRLPHSDPGADKHSPYRMQHLIADAAERVVAAFLGIDWAAYDAEVDKPPEL